MIIGVLGFAGSGKGTVADILVGKGFRKESFASPVKDAVAAIFGWERVLLEGETAESRAFREAPDEWWSKVLGKEITPRYMLQLMGTEAGRNVFHQDIWIRALQKKLEQNESEGVHSVIADVRFPNECEFIRSVGGQLVSVQRGKEPEWYDTARLANSESLSSDTASEAMNTTGVHYSEWAWIGQPVNYNIKNDSSLSMLEADTNHMLKVLFGSNILNSNIKL